MAEVKTDTRPCRRLRVRIDYPPATKQVRESGVITARIVPSGPCRCEACRQSWSTS